MKASDLTDAQKELLLYLGSSANGKAISKETWDELCALGIIYRRGDGNFDLTSTGERVYKEIRSGR